MDACPLLITSIVAVKPEDQGTFFQDFLGLSGYLCSVPEMLRTSPKKRARKAPSRPVHALLGGAFLRVVQHFDSQSISIAS